MRQQVLRCRSARLKNPAQNERRSDCRQGLCCPFGAESAIPLVKKSTKTSLWSVPSANRTALQGLRVGQWLRMKTWSQLSGSLKTASTPIRSTGLHRRAPARHNRGYGIQRTDHAGHHRHTRLYHRRAMENRHILPCLPTQTLFLWNFQTPVQSRYLQRCATGHPRTLLSPKPHGKLFA